MHILLFSKNNDDQLELSLADWDTRKINNIPDFLTKHGTISLISVSAFERIRRQFENAGFCNCGEKNDKIQLKRALRFDEKRDRDKPKLLIFNSSNIGALKRSLSAFFSNHFKIEDPPCLIIIPENIFETLKIEGVKKTAKKANQHSSMEKDSLFHLMNIPESNPLTKKIEKVYIGNSIEVQHTRALIYRACQTDSPVLILGETGTGKDVIANQIHENSPNSKDGFLRINCSALQESLLEGELFGYKKGIFTGAYKDNNGLFNTARAGTVFLDEIGDLSLANQVKILHAVENREIRQIGSNQSKPFNARIISATNRNLFAMMNQGTFREDLYFRINTFLINAYPLREHPEDIPLLAKTYWEKKGRKSPLSKEFLDYLKTYHWPGNVRELNALLNSLADYFGDVSPKPAHVEAIRKSRQEVLVQAKSSDKDDPAQLLKIKSQHILISVQNILRSIKIEMRPFIHNQSGLQSSTLSTENLKDFIGQQLVILNELCTEPSYFKRWDVFKKTAKYRFVLDSLLSHWPESAEQLCNYWDKELQKLDDDINQGIMEVLWGKIDM